MPGALGARDATRNLKPLIGGGGEQEEVNGNGGNGNGVNGNRENGNRENGNGGNGNKEREMEMETEEEMAITSEDLCLL
ncbi:hypothetical protein Tco_1262108 [Tanacetum coccineum]